MEGVHCAWKGCVSCVRGRGVVGVKILKMTDILN